jgi:ankyrin repeat protein
MHIQTGDPLHFKLQLTWATYTLRRCCLRPALKSTRKRQTGRTALHFAVVGDHLDVIRFLIEKGAEVNARDAEGTSPLDDAVWRGYLDVTAILLAHGARLNEAETKTGATPINEAAYLGKTPLVQYLLQFNPDLGIHDKGGHTLWKMQYEWGKRIPLSCYLKQKRRGR